MHHTVLLNWGPIIFQLKTFYLSLLSFPLQLRISEMEMNKARNLIEHEEEIFSRPPRVWFQSKADLKRESGKRPFKFEVLDGFDAELKFQFPYICVFVHR